MTWLKGCRPLRWPEEVSELQRLVAECHPERTPRPDLYFFAHPTIVTDDEDGIVGYAVMSMAPAIEGVPHPAVYCHDTGVHPRARGAGLGRILLLLRWAIGRQCGATIAVGTVNPENRQMAAIHRETGMEAVGPLLPGCFTDVSPAADGRVMRAGPEALDAAVDEMLLEATRRWDRP